MNNKLQGPNTKQVIDKMKRYVYDSTFVYPLVIANGHDCIIEDLDGNRFLDFTSNIGACPIGYSHPDIMEILAEYSTNGTHKIAGQDFYSKEHAELAEEISKIVPANFKSFLINSGAEAVENAIKIAYRKMGPLPGVSCLGAFHGRTLGALTFTCSKPVHKYNFPEHHKMTNGLIKKFQHLKRGLYSTKNIIQVTNLKNIWGAKHPFCVRVLFWKTINQYR